MKRLLSLFLCFFTVSYFYVQASVEVLSTFMTSEDGVANNTIRYIYQDSKGFIWLGTLNGLNRYDGYSFETFRPEGLNKISLADPRIKNMFEDKNGFLWISTSSDQFSCYDLKKECFVNFTGSHEYQKQYAYLVAAGNGDIWLWRNSSGCRRIVYKDGRFTSLEFSEQKKNLKSNEISFLFVDSDGHVWIGGPNGISEVKGDHAEVVWKDFKAYAVLEYQKSLFFISSTGQIVRKDKAGRFENFARISNDRNLVITGRFLLGNQCVLLTDQGTFRINLRSGEVSEWQELNMKNGIATTDNKGDYWIHNQTGTVRYISAKSGRIKTFQLLPAEKMGYIDRERYHIVHDSRGLIWISTYGNGLFLYNPQTDELKHFVSNMNGYSHIRSNFLHYVLEDRSGNIWVASEYTGISCLTILNNGATRIFPEDLSLTDRSNAVRLIKRLKNGDIAVGTRSGGLYFYDAKMEKLTQKKLYHANVYDLMEDAEGKLWIGSRGDGLCIGDRWYTYKSKDPGSLSENNVFCMLMDHKNRAWIGTFGGGLNLAEPTTNGYIFRKFLNANYGQSQIRSILEDRNGMIWAGTSDGVVIFEPDKLLKDTNDYIIYSYNNHNFPANEVKCIYQDKKGNIWLSVSGAGVCVCKPENDYHHLTFKHYNSSKGLANDMVQCILEDHDGRIWVSTEYGVSRFDPEHDMFETFFFSSNALGNVYSESCGCQGPDSALLFGTNYGLVSIAPNDIQKVGPYSPDVVLTNLKVNGVTMLPGGTDSPLVRSLAYSDEIHLNYDQNSFVIDFSIFDYAVNNNAKYSYRLEHFDHDWSTPSSLNFASYKNLEPGTYLLHVKATNGVMWSKEKVLKIVVRPPLWRTTWAILAYLVFIGLAVSIAFRLMRNFARLRNRVQIEKQLTEYKLVFFTNISHEFRTSLTLIQGALERIENGSIPKEMAYSVKIMDKSTQRLLRLINQLLEFRKMQNNKLALSLEETDVIAFSYELFLSYKDTSESKNMDFQFKPSVDAFNMYIDKEKLDKIIYNLLSNAFKYTPSGGKIIFSVGVDEALNQVKITVADSGVGIPKEKQGELFSRFMQSSFSGNSVGVGLHLTHELVAVHKGQIEYRENEGGGSVFIVTLPINPSVYEERDFLIPHNVLIEEEKNHQKTDDREVTPEQPMLQNPLNKRKILIIEDDDDLRNFLKQEIGAYFEVEVEADGLAGLDRAHSFESDLIVCDVMMPGLNGFEVTRRLKNDFETSHIPIILLTAMASVDNQLKGLESGADAYITKPFSPKLLLARIFQLIEQRDKLQKKYSHEPTLERSAICTTDKDKQFADQLLRVMEEQMGNAQFTVDEFAAKMNLGRTVFYRKVKGVTGYSPNEYIRVMRMKKAAKLLLESQLTVSEVSYQVGINDPFYFSKCFKQQFGVAPSVYQKGDGEQSSSSVEKNM